MFALDRTIWRSSISLETKLYLYNTIFASFRCVSMGQRHGRLLQPYQGRLTPRITGALGASCTGQSLLPMMRFVPVVGSRCCQTLSGAVCPSLAISTEQIHARTTTELCRPALRTLMQIGDEGLAVPDNHGSERWRPTCVH